MTDNISKISNSISDLHFMMLGKECGGDIDCIYDSLIDVGTDKNTLGFWVWNIPNNRELYSPKFRDTLGFESEEDFPNVPESWQRTIQKHSLKRAYDAYHNHVDSRGKVPYNVEVTYTKKYGDSVDLLCYGKVILWKKDTPIVMVGFHLTPDGMFTI